MWPGKVLPQGFYPRLQEIPLVHKHGKLEQTENRGRVGTEPNPTTASRCRNLRPAALDSAAISSAPVALGRLRRALLRLGRRKSNKYHHCERVPNAGDVQSCPSAAGI